MQQHGLDTYAATNLVRYLDEQREATNLVPHDRQLVVERFRDELGDWRMVLHSPYGMAVHAPWALAVNARLRERYGVDGQAMASDDGIVIRVPDSDQDPPGADVVVFEPEEIEQLVTDEVGGSALFASRFRECAARALLLPRRDPGRRSPLWQQRQRSAQLLEVAVQYPTFPIVLEAVREVLQDVYDLPALVALLGAVQRREVSVVEVATTQPSPFARTLLFGYVAQFLYEGDSPIAERRAAALCLDQSLLAELLGRAELRELLDPDVLAEVEADLQWLSEDRRARDAEGVADMLRLLGPLSAGRGRRPGAAPAPRWPSGSRDCEPPAGWSRSGWPDSRSGAPWRRSPGCATGSACRCLRAPRWPSPSRRRTRSATSWPAGHAPTVRSPSSRSPPGSGSARRSSGTPSNGSPPRGRVLDGEFRPSGTGTEWCDAQVLRRLRRRSLARLRQEVEPVTPETLARFLPAWQKVTIARGALRGVDGVVAALDQLAGCAVPASALEPLVLAARVRDYQPAFLDELTASGEVLWAGHGSLPGSDGWVSLHLADQAHLTLPEPVDKELDELQLRVLEALRPGGAFFFRQLADQVGSVSDPTLSVALWDLVWSGYVSNDTLVPAAQPGPQRYSEPPHPAPPAAHRPDAGAHRSAGDRRAVVPPAGP